MNPSNKFCLFQCFPPYFCIIFPWLQCISCKTSLYSKPVISVNIGNPPAGVRIWAIGARIFYVCYNWVSDALKWLLSGLSLATCYVSTATLCDTLQSGKQLKIVDWCSLLWNFCVHSMEPYIPATGAKSHVWLCMSTCKFYLTKVV